MDQLKGKKTYILVALALIAGVANYVGIVIERGFNLNELLTFINGEAVTAAIAALRMGVGSAKK